MKLNRHKPGILTVVKYNSLSPEEKVQVASYKATAKRKLRNFKKVK